MMENFDELTFDIFKFEKELNNRRKVLPLMTLNAMDKLNLVEGFWAFDTEKLAKFLNQVQSTYQESVQYHNDLHGADVMHMCYYFLKQTRMIHTLDLTELDTLAFIVSAVCHDLGHDGYTNGYHVNTISPRAIDSNDVAV